MQNNVESLNNAASRKIRYDRKGIVDDSIDAAKIVSKGDDNNGHNNDHRNASKWLRGLSIKAYKSTLVYTFY